MTSKACFILPLFPVDQGIAISPGETYQWKDGNGQTVVSDIPTAVNTQGRRSIDGVKPTSVSKRSRKQQPTPKVFDAPKNIAEKDLELQAAPAGNRRRRTSRLKASHLKTIVGSCDRSRHNLVRARSNQPVVSYMMTKASATSLTPPREPWK
ncbi:MAG: DUF4124 domain-containing protein [Betaproteobacteria bacterium]|nr:DUF4124 domain-containing protein [Betaproteobacteria bacterium]